MAVSPLLYVEARKEVVPMGNRRWAKALRFVLVFLAVFGLLVYIAPKAC